MQITKVCDRFGEPYHRWFDAGDLADVAMLKAIVRVCELTPTIKHWLPTRESAEFSRLSFKPAKPCRQTLSFD